MDEFEFRENVESILENGDQVEIHDLLSGMEHVECESLVDAGMFRDFAESKYEEMLDLLVRKGLVNRYAAQSVWEKYLAQYPNEKPAWDWEEPVIEIFLRSYPLVPVDDYCFIVPFLCSHWLAEHPEDLSVEDCIAFMGSEDYEDAWEYCFSWGTPEDLAQWGYLHYVVGDATHPVNTASKKHVITHCCNDIGAWGAGFVLAVDKLSPLPKAKYKAWKEAGSPPMELGMVQVVDLSDKLAIANLIGQHGIRSSGGEPPIRYDALETALNKLCKRMAGKLHVWNPYDLHMPRIGCGLAGGEWDKVEEILLRVAREYSVHIYVYDLPEAQNG